MSESTTVSTHERPPAGWLPMLFIGLGVALIIMDATIVNVILPSIIAELNIDSIDAEWINAVYSLTFAAFLIVMGRFGDKYGRRKVFTLGAALFGIASVLSALSTSGGMLISARALQGIGGAMMSPTSLSLVNANYRGKSRAIAFALYGSIIGGMAAIGPLMGGWLTERFSWHWSFWINVPIALFIIFGALKFVPESVADRDSGKTDFVGAVLSTLGIASLIFALIEGRNYGWLMNQKTQEFLGMTWEENSFSPVAYAFAIAALSLTSLVVLENKRLKAGKSVLIDFTLFRIATFGLGSFAGLIVSLGEFGILFSLPLFLQSVLGWSSLGAGAILAILALGAFIAAPSAGQLANKRNPRFVARLGLVLEIVGILGLGLFISPTVSGWVLGPWLFLYGMGVGYASAQLTGLILSEVPDAQVGQASGTQSTARQIGAALGTAILGTILFVSLHHGTETRFIESGMPAGVASELSAAVEQSAGTIIGTLEAPEVRLAASEAYADAVRSTALIAAGFVFLGLLSTLALPPGTRREEDNSKNLINDFE